MGSNCSKSGLPRHSIFLTLIIYAALLLSTVVGQTAPVKAETGVSAYAFELNEVHLDSGRWQQNEVRTTAYLKFVNIDRILYVFRNNHKVSTNGAQSVSGWDAPNFPFRSHFQGHLLTAWAQCFAQQGDSTCASQAKKFVVELQKCQNNNGAAGFTSGYLSGFPESEFVNLEAGKLTGGNVPYYAVHKTMAGLLDVWRLIGDNNAKTVLLSMASWVDARTSKLSLQQMQNVLGTEFGGMNAVLADIYYMTGDTKWINVAKRFDHNSVFGPLASNQDRLNGLHANTNIPKWIGAAREYKATGNATYQAIARNAWSITVNAHTYAIGANSQAEHFKAPNVISGALKTDTAEACNSYNMLKLTRELWVMNPSTTTYFDFYERTLINHLIGQQNPSDSHGHVTYFTPLNPGGKRGVGPAWGGGTWSTDYSSFWCCQGTGVETNTKLADSIYFYDSSSLYVNLFAPSTLNWKARSTTIKQTTNYPVGDTTTLQITGSGTWTMKIRVPAWSSGVVIKVNGANAGVSTTPGTYAAISRSWATGDTVTVTIPLNFRLVPANDNSALAAIAYGPTVLSANYGSTALSSNPSLTLSSLKRTSSSSLAFTATANGQNVNLGPFYDAQGFNYAVYFAVSGSLPAATAPGGGNPSTPTTVATSRPATTAVTSKPPTGTGAAAQYAQCGGIGWQGATACVSPFKCTVLNEYYSQSKTKTPPHSTMADAKAPRAPTEKEAFFFLTIFQCLTNKPEVDWDLVASRAGYASASCAKVRFGQIKKAIGYTENGVLGAATTTPIKGRAKKETNVGSGTNKTPTKVTKVRAPRKSKSAKVKAEVDTEEDDKKMVKEEADELAEGDGGDAYTFDNPLHEQLYKSYPADQDDDELEDENQ
ncbi:hypothetical protein VTL71DRAFT_2736 [Oculimacula yallundae]|uniref:CBM1 domain-containing protein n=1 Tax=Oculimacula yallundae TaxID=86028 RepID=A0ABR4CBU0_9HELO